MKQIALFASGMGSNAQRIIDHTRLHPGVNVSLIVCNKPGAGVLDIAEKEGIPYLMVEKETFFRGNAYKEFNCGKKGSISPSWQDSYGRSLPRWYRLFGAGSSISTLRSCPNTGGKGMYGRHVHESVIAAGDRQSGITIHYVDELYDHGQVIFQAICEIEEGETPESLAQKIHLLEYAHFPEIVEKVLDLRSDLTEAVKKP